MGCLKSNDGCLESDEIENHCVIHFSRDNFTLDLSDLLRSKAVFLMVSALSAHKTNLLYSKYVI